MKKNAQTSLEFLMTYGWAILIILVVLLVAWQWGLFNPKGVEKGKAGFWGIVPEDFAFVSDGSGTLKLSLKNEVGATVNITSINVTVGDKSDSTLPGLNHAINSGGIYYRDDFTGFSQMQAGSRFEALVSVDYIDDRTGKTYRSTGKIWGSVEEV